MPHAYALEHLTALPCSLPELVHVAAEAGYEYVGLRTMPLGLPGEPSCELARDQALLRRTKNALAVTGLKVSDVELVKITETMVPHSFESGFAAAAELGATDVTTSIWTPDALCAQEMFAAVCEVARPFGLRLNVEFVAIADVKTLGGAVALLRSVDATNVGLLLDTYHVHRAGTDPSELDSLPADWFHACQLCDAPAVIPQAAEELREEVRERRLYLGEGGIDVRAVLAHVPDVIYALEIPNNARLQALGAAAYASSCLATAKAYFDDR